MDSTKDNTLDIIPGDAIMTIEVSGVFYQRIQNNLFALLRQEESNPELPNILKELEEREPTNSWEEQVTLLLTLSFAIDEAALKQKLIVKQDMTEHFPNPAEEASPES
jgi:hypothetical protein